MKLLAGIVAARCMGYCRALALALLAAVPRAAMAVCIPIDLGNVASVTQYDDSSTAANDVGDSACGPVPGQGGSAAPELAYQWTAPEAGLYVVTAQSGEFDVLLSVRDGSCSGPELGCNTLFPGVPPRAALLLALAANQTVTIVVDGRAAVGGFFALNVWRQFAPCLDMTLLGTVAAVEASATTYPPLAPVCTTGAADLEIAHSFTAPDLFTTRDVLLRWDTSVIPTDAVVSSLQRPGAQLSVTTSTTAVADSRQLIGEWVQWDGTCAPGQYEPATLAESFTRTIEEVAPFTHQEFTLDGYETYVDPQGPTSLRLRISAGQPSDANQVTMAGEQHPAYAPPVLMLSLCYPSFLPTSTPTPTDTPTPTPTATPEIPPTPGPGCCALSGGNPIGATCIDNLMLTENGAQTVTVSSEVCAAVSAMYLNGDPVLHVNLNHYCNPNPGDPSGSCPPVPAAPDAAAIIAWDVVNGQITVTGRPGSVGANHTVVIRNTRTGQEVLTTAASDGSFAVAIGALERDVLIIQARDSIGSESATTTVDVLPPAPQLVAPELDRTLATTVFDSTAFLYTPPFAIQVDMAANAIKLERSAVVRGTVLDANGDPLSGIKVSVVGHPDYGYTLSRSDGAFDLAVNGGALLTLQYEGAGPFTEDRPFTAQRNVEVPWQSYAFAPDVVLLQPDPQETMVALGPGQALQPALGSIEGQGAETRQAFLIFPPNVTVTAGVPGCGQPCALDVRITEHTVGPLGPQAMPGELPPTSAYTYAFTLSADGVDPDTPITFSTPLPFYVENFIGFPVGMRVPLGSYDVQDARWEPAPNGRVVKVLGTAGALDADGDGDADANDDALLPGITPEERAAIASRYSSGNTLWRLALSFFSRWDANWPGGAPTDAIAPNGGLPSGMNEERLDDPDVTGDGTIVVQNQALRQSVEVVGTPYTLTYDSSRQLERASSQTMTIPLSGTTPASLRRIELDIAIGGRLIQETYEPGPGGDGTDLANLTHPFTWDGLDAYGRPLQGWQGVQVEVRFVYPRVYDQPAQDPAAFALTSGTAIAGFSNTRAEITSGVRFEGMLGGWDTKELGLGGWDVDIHHTYDPVRRMLSGGAGSQTTQGQLEPSIDTIMGGGTALSIVDGVTRAVPTRIPDTHSTAVQLFEPFGVAVGPDGRAYVSDFGGHIVIRRNTDGTVTRIAGGGNQPVTPAGVEARLASIPGPQALVFGPDGALYLSSYFGHVVYRIDLDSTPITIRTVAGNGTQCSAHCVQFGPCAPACGLGGPALQANLSIPSGLAVARDGTLYIGDSENQVLAVGTDGIIRRVASGFFLFHLDVALTADGSLLVAGGNNRIRRIAPDGRSSVFAGITGTFNDTGDGLAATQATFNAPWGLTVDSAGGVFVVDAQNANRVRYISPDGIVSAVVSQRGNGSGFAGDRGPAAAAKLNSPLRTAVAPDGSLYVTDAANDRVRKITSPLPGLASVTEIPIPSRDGREIYVFNSRGRHLKTVDALVRDSQVPPQPVVRYAFGYDQNTGRLTSITDANGQITLIDQDESQITITGPFEQETTIALDGNGYVESITNPDGDATQFDFSDEGRLNSLTDAETHVTTFGYDTSGRLTSATYPSGSGSDVLARTNVVVTVPPDGEVGRGYLVTHQRTQNPGEVVETGYQTVVFDSGRQERTTFLPNTTTETRVININGSDKTTGPTGVENTVTEGPDARFGMQAPVNQTTTVRSPAGLQASVSQSRVTDPANLTDPFGFTTHTETVTVNGRPVTRRYTAATRTYVDTSPANRTTTTVVDGKSRPTQQQVGNLAPTGFSYDGGTGQLTQVAQGARTTTIAYDTEGNVESVTDAANRTVSFEYDDAGRVTTQTLPDLRTISLAYDSKGNVTSITPPGQPPHAHQFSYSPTSLPLTYAPPPVGAFNPNTTYDYNLSGQLFRINRPDGVDVVLTYDPVTGDLISQSWGGTTQRGFVYDQDSGNLELVAFPDGTLTYAYDGSLLKSETWDGTIDGSVSRTYDTSFRVSTQSVNNANLVTYTYDPDDLLTGAVLGSANLTLTRSAQSGLLTGTTLSSVTDSYGYNSFGEVTSYSATISGNSTPIFSVTYTRDNLGRIDSKTETIDGSGPTTVHYQYDPAGRLERVCANEGCTTTIHAEYDYDDNGNRVSGGLVVSATYDDQDRLQTATIGPKTYDYVYTENGELLSKTNQQQPSDVTTYAYDPLGNLLHAELPSGADLDYIIDGRDRRIGKKVNGTLIQRLLFDGQLTPIAEVDGTGTVTGRFVYGSKSNIPDYIVRGATTYRIISDHLGSPRLVINAGNGTVVQRMDYDEFGNVIDDTNPGFQPFGFAGGIWDTDDPLVPHPGTGLVRFGARDYDPQTGRWTAKDPIGFRGRDGNLYAYTLGDPINLVDTNGKLLSEAEIAVGGFVAGVLQNSAVSAGVGVLASLSKRESVRCVLSAAWDGATSPVNLLGGAFGAYASLALHYSPFLIHAERLAGDTAYEFIRSGFFYALPHTSPEVGIASTIASILFLAGPAGEGASVECSSGPPIP